MTPRRAPSLPAFLLLALVCVVASACERGPSRDSTEGDGPATAVAVLHRGNGADPGTLDPHLVEEGAAGQVVRDLYEGLTTEAADASLAPGVAESWEIDQGGRRIEFTLRRDARWSNGDAVVAEDFVFALRRALDPATGAPLAHMLLPIRGAAEVLAGVAATDALGVFALGPGTLVIELETPAPYFLYVLANPVAFPVHRETLAGHGRRFSRPGIKVSNGPYRLDEWVVQSHVRLVRNAHFHARDEVAIGEVVYHVTEDMVAEFNRYRAGELHMTFQVPVAQLRRARQHLPAEVRTDPYFSTYFLLVNLQSEAMRSLAVRQALSMGVDRDLLVEGVLGAGERPAYGFVPPGFPGYVGARHAWADWSPADRLAEARRLLLEAGYGPERPLKVQLHYNVGENHRRIAVAVASMWRESLAVEVTLVNLEWKALLQLRWDPGAWQLLRFGWAADYNDPFAFLELMSASQRQNVTGWSDPDYDALLTAANAAADPARRMELLASAETLLLADAPVIPIYYSVSRRLVSAEVRGFVANPLNRIQSRYLALDGR